MGTASLLERSLQAFRTSPRDHGGHEGDEGRCAGDDRRRSDEEDCRVYAAQDEGREGCPRRPADHRLRRGEEDREVRDPATHDAEAEAQARTEGGQEDDVREGGEGGGEACLEGGEGLPREGSQGLDLSHGKEQDSVRLARWWSCHGPAPTLYI